MSHDDLGRRASKRRRLSNESSTSRIEGYQHGHDPHGCSLPGTWRPPASVADSVPVHYERFDYSRETSIGCHDNSTNLQYQCISSHASALTQPLTRTTKASSPSYTRNDGHLLSPDAHPGQSLAAILNPEITGAPMSDVTVTGGEESTFVCFGMVS